MKDKKNMKINKTKILFFLLISLVIIFFIIFFLLINTITNNNNENENQKIVSSNLNVKKINLTHKLNIVASKNVIKYNGKNLNVFTYNNQIPGPTIRGKIGDRIVINFTNKLDEKTSIHWHGLQIENEMDGVPGLTQDPINPNENFIYNYTLKNPGVYWYHPHFDSYIQVDMGLYGAIIVDYNKEDTKKIKSDKDEIIFLDDFRLRGGEISTGASMMDRYMSGKYGNTYLINGKPSYDLKVKNNEILRLRLINPSNARIYNFAIEDNEFTVIGQDIGLVKKPYSTKIITIAPGERYDVLIHINSSKNFLTLRNFLSNSEYSVIGKIEILKNENKEISNENKLYLKNLKNEILNKNIINYFKNNKSEKYNLTFSLNRNNGMNNIKWFVNGKNLNENPEILNLEKGKYYKLKLKNLDMHPHPIHIHGQKFLILNRTYNVQGSVNQGFKDTVILYGNEEIEIGFIAEGIGSWLTHCHILEHVDFGMGAIIKIK